MFAATIATLRETVAAVVMKLSVHHHHHHYHQFIGSKTRQSNMCNNTKRAGQEGH